MHERDGVSAFLSCHYLLDGVVFLYGFEADGYLALPART